MDNAIVTLLKKRNPSKEITELKDFVTKLLKESRSVMSKKYTQWDCNNDIYQGIRPPDAEDKKANRDGEPQKMVVPLSYAQIQTFVSFCFLLFTQGKFFFSLSPTGAEDHELQSTAELTLERDLRRQKWVSTLYQLLLDIGRFGIGIVKTTWVNETVIVPQLSNSTGELDMTYSEDDLTIKAVKYQGNKVISVSPYHWFPDTRKPLTEWESGQFCADEREWTLEQLKELEKKKVIAGMEFVTPLSKISFEGRKGTRLPGISEEFSKNASSKKLAIVTEIQIKLVPADYGLGVEKFEVFFVIWVVNDDRIVRIERMGYAHQEFTWDMAQMSPDMHRKVGESLSDVIFNLQDVVTWLINTRIVSVRRGINGKIIADPDAFDSASFENNESPVVWLKSGAPKLGNVSAFFGQVPYSDPTQSHFQDADFITGLVQRVTGINENVMGSFTGGRRSATEARAVNAGAAGRLKTQASLIFWDLLNPMGRKMLSNQRQGMDFNVFQRIVGMTPSVIEDYQKFHVQDVTELIGNEDFFMFDLTLDSEKGFIAQSLQELLQSMMGNPETAQMFDINPKALLEEIMELRGVGKLERFSWQAQQQQNGLQEPNLLGLGEDPQIAGQLQAVPSV